MIGSAEEIVDAHQLLGIDRFYGQFDWGGLPRTLVEESLHRTPPRSHPQYATPPKPRKTVGAGALGLAGPDALAYQAAARASVRQKPSSATPWRAARRLMIESHRC